MCPSETGKCGQVEVLANSQVNRVEFQILPIYSAGGSTRINKRSNNQYIWYVLFVTSFPELLGFS